MYEYRVPNLIIYILEPNLTEMWSHVYKTHCTLYWTLRTVLKYMRHIIPHKCTNDEISWRLYATVCSTACYLEYHIPVAKIKASPHDLENAGGIHDLEKHHTKDCVSPEVYSIISCWMNTSGGQSFFTNIDLRTLHLCILISDGNIRFSCPVKTDAC